jgi:putative DNA methylase
MGAQLMAIVAEGQKGRVYLAPTPEQEAIANSAEPKWKPDTDLPKEALGFRVQNYGMTKHADLFTPRQLVALTTFSDLVGEAREKATQDAVAAGLTDDDVPLNDGGTGARAYGEAIATYLAIAIDKGANLWSSLCSWMNDRGAFRETFARQAIPMVWDFAEANPFSNSGGNFEMFVNRSVDVLEFLTAENAGNVLQHDAATQGESDSVAKLISSDPPYYDAVPYADLSDFFYVWLRYSIGSIHPDIFSTLLVPKSQEMVADNFRHGSKSKAKDFFESSLIKVFHRANRLNHHGYPLTVYYALKQTETDSNEQVASTGWETILEGLIQSSFSIDGTWPVRTESSGRIRATGSNALASSIVLVCRPRPSDAPKTTRRQFLTELKRQLPKALKTLQQGNIAPVDLAQASIGPGMAIFSKYAAVLENDGSPMRVRTALQLINQILDEFLTEQEGEFDGDTRWALTWFEQHQFASGQYGDAETLSKAKNTSVQGMVEAGILEAKAGKVRLLKRDELKPDWNPNQDDRMPDWEVAQYLIHELDQNGEFGAAELLAKLGDRGEAARDLAYRLYSLCDRKGWAQEGIAYNSLVISWPEITRLAGEFAQPEQVQGSLGF